MKRNIITTIFGLSLLSIALTSCDKCQTCHDGLNSFVVCKSDYADNKTYKDAIEVIEATGKNCN